MLRLADGFVRNLELGDPQKKTTQKLMIEYICWLYIQGFYHQSQKDITGIYNHHFQTDPNIW